MSHFNVRIPPDSTGKRIATLVENILDYNSGTIKFVVGDTVVGTTSGATGDVVLVTDSVISGHVHINIAFNSPENFANGEDLQVEGVTYATANGIGEAVHTQQATLVGGNNPNNTQFVDDRGASYTRFAGGSPSFDAFGKTRVSQETILGDYMHAYDVMPEKYLTTEVGGGALTYEANTHAVLMSTGTAAGDKVERTTHKYHKYQPGVSQLVMFTVAAGDAGKANLIRWLGYGDSMDGLFWRMTDNNVSVFIRNSTSGSVVETIIDQADWNVDRLDGSTGPGNLTNILIDPTKDNVFWIDFQWLGAGRVRFGLVVDGLYITSHEFNNANNNPRSYMRTGSLPITYGQENIGAVASSSELRLWCATVKTEGSFNPFQHRFGHVMSNTTTVNNDVTNIPIYSIRGKQTFKGIDNRVWGFLENMQFIVSGDPVIIEFVRNPILTDETFVDYAEASSSMEIDAAATAATGGVVLAAGVISGSRELPASNIFGVEKEIILREADITVPVSYTLRARTLTNATSANVNIAVNWFEII